MVFLVTEIDNEQHVKTRLMPQIFIVLVFKCYLHFQNFWINVKKKKKKQIIFSCIEEEHN